MIEIIRKYLGNKALVAALTYLVFFLPRFTPHKGSKDIHFHMKQSIGLLVCALSLQGALSILFYWGGPSVLVWFVRIPLLFLLVVGMRNAWKNEQKELPWIGRYATRTFEGMV